MKILLTSLLLVVGFHFLQAQDHRLYWKYKDYDGAIPVAVPGWAIEVGSWFVPEKPERRMIRKVNKVRVLVFEGDNPITERDRQKFDRRASRRHLEDLLMVREGKTHVRVMAKDRRQAMRKLVVFVQSPEEFVLVSVRGKLRLDEIAKVLNKVTKDKGGIKSDIIPEVLDVPVNRI